MLPIVVALMIAVCVAGNIRRDAEQLCPSSGIIAPLPAQVDSPANFTVCDGSVNPVRSVPIPRDSKLTALK